VRFSALELSAGGFIPRPCGKCAIAPEFKQAEASYFSVRFSALELSAGGFIPRTGLKLSAGGFIPRPCGKCPADRPGINSRAESSSRLKPAIFQCALAHLSSQPGDLSLGHVANANISAVRTFSRGQIPRQMPANRPATSETCHGWNLILDQTCPKFKP